MFLYEFIGETKKGGSPRPSTAHFFSINLCNPSFRQRSPKWWNRNLL